MANITGKLALGITGIALTAGGMVAGAALSKEENRKALRKNFLHSLKGLKGTLSDAKQRYQAFTHELSLNNNKLRKVKA